MELEVTGLHAGALVEAAILEPLLRARSRRHSGRNEERRERQSPRDEADTRQARSNPSPNSKSSNPHVGLLAHREAGKVTGTCHFTLGAGLDVLVPWVS